jgi:hypothetical protein
MHILYITTRVVVHNRPTICIDQPESSNQRIIAHTHTHNTHTHTHTHTHQGPCTYCTHHFFYFENFDIVHTIIACMHLHHLHHRSDAALDAHEAIFNACASHRQFCFTTTPFRFRTCSSPPWMSLKMISFFFSSVGPAHVRSRRNSKSY